LFWGEKGGFSKVPKSSAKKRVAGEGKRTDTSSEGKRSVTLGGILILRRRGEREEYPLDVKRGGGKKACQTSRAIVGENDCREKG